MMSLQSLLFHSTKHYAPLGVATVSGTGNTGLVFLTTAYRTVFGYSVAHKTHLIIVSDIDKPPHANSILRLHSWIHTSHAPSNERGFWGRVGHLQLLQLCPWDVSVSLICKGWMICVNWYPCEPRVLVVDSFRIECSEPPTVVDTFGRFWKAVVRVNCASPWHLNAELENLLKIW